VAPPSPRRPGFSRRAQYSLFAGYVTTVAGALAGLLLVLTARFDPAGHAVLQNAISDVLSPASSVFRGVGAGFSRGYDEVAAYFDAAAKNRAMKRELEAARQKLIKGQADALELHRLKRLVNLVERLPQASVRARLVSSTGASSRRYAVFAAGSGDGVMIGQPIRTSEGLVGRVVQVGRLSARVLMIIDGGNIVPVKRVKDGIPALAYGIGDGTLDLRPLAAGAGNPFKAGDVFVTSGTGGIYQPGIPVAIAIRRLRDSSIARPLADPARFDFAVAETEFVETPPPQPNAVEREGR
jgi:rod shape-determining protein MreC